MNSAIVKPLVEVSGAEEMGAAITVHGLTKQFGRTRAIDGLNMRVPRGSVYALLGRNGAGKSTVIQVLMGMLDPTQGEVDILGLNPTRDGVALKKLIGYIPDRLPMYDWMTVSELLRFVASFYDRWSAEDETQLIQQFRIKRDMKVGALSRGNRALLSLVVAMAHRPDLVLLDECTSGMDAIARREFERSVIDALQAGNRTVLFASHQIDEMERICDWVGIMDAGRMLVEMPLDDLKSSVRMLRLKSDAEPTDLRGCTILTRRTSGREDFVTVRLDSPELWPTPRAAGIAVLEDIPLSLEEIFVALVGTEDNV